MVHNAYHCANKQVKSAATHVRLLEVRASSAGYFLNSVVLSFQQQSPCYMLRAPTGFFAMYCNVRDDANCLQHPALSTDYGSLLRGPMVFRMCHKSPPGQKPQRFASAGTASFIGQGPCARDPRNPVQTLLKFSCKTYSACACY